MRTLSGQQQYERARVSVNVMTVVAGVYTILSMSAFHKAERVRERVFLRVAQVLYTLWTPPTRASRLSALMPTITECRLPGSIGFVRTGGQVPLAL